MDTFDYWKAFQHHTGTTIKLRHYDRMLQSEIEALQAKNAGLANVYETAKKLSEELARGAGDLATTLEKTPVDQPAGEDSPEAEAELEASRDAG